MKKFSLQLIFILLFACVSWICTGCGSTKPSNISLITYKPGTTHVFVPQSPGKDTISEGALTLDFSNSSQGYFTAALSEDQKVNLQIIGPDDVTYKYFIETSNYNEVFPFTAGDGAYLVLAFECIGGEQYTPLLNYSLDVKLENEFLPFLYPNQFVQFTEDSEAIHLAAELSADQEEDLDALEAIYSYITSSIRYDDEKAATVQSGYLPDIDETLSTQKGICFDYAALAVAMLRSLSIPTRLNIGYSGDIRHAWIDVYIQSIGWVEKVIEFKGNQWHIMDPTFASAFDDSKQAAKYIGDGENYILEYIR